jgi:hypothetical protein
MIECACSAGCHNTLETDIHGGVPNIFVEHAGKSIRTGIALTEASARELVESLVFYFGPDILPKVDAEWTG